MFKKFAKHEKKIMIVLAVALTVGFGVGGSYTIKQFFTGMGRGGSGMLIGDVFGTSYYERDYYREQVALQMLGRLQLGYGQSPFGQVVFPRTGGQMPLADYPYYKANLHLARQAGIMATDKEVSETLAYVLMLYRSNKGLSVDDFNADAYYRELMRENRLDRKDFESVLRDVLIVRKWMDLVQAAAVVSPDSVWLTYRTLARKVSLHYVSLSEEAIAKSLEAPDDKVLATWLEEQLDDPMPAASLDVPARVSFDVLEVPIDEVAQLADVVKVPADAEIEAWYDSHKTRFLDFEAMKATYRPEWQKTHKKDTAPDDKKDETPDVDEPDWLDRNTYPEEQFVYKPVTDEAVRQEVSRAIMMDRARKSAVEKTISLRQEIVERLLADGGGPADMFKAYAGVWDGWAGLPKLRTVELKSREEVQAMEHLGKAVAVDVTTRRPGSDRLVDAIFDVKPGDVRGSSVPYASLGDDRQIERLMLVRRLEFEPRKDFGSWKKEEMPGYLATYRERTLEAWRQDQANKRAKAAAEQLKESLTVDGKVDWDGLKTRQAELFETHGLSVQTVEKAGNPTLGWLMGWPAQDESPEVLQALQVQLYGDRLDLDEPIVQRADKTWYVVTIDSVSYPERQDMEANPQAADTIRSRMASQGQRPRITAYFDYLDQNVRFSREFEESLEQRSRR